MIHREKEKACAGPEVGTGSLDPPPAPRKSQVAVCFLKNTGMDPLEKQLDPSWVQLLIEEGPYNPL